VPEFPREFETERLLIRMPEPDIAADVHAAIHETWDDLHEWMDWARERPSLKQCRQYLRDARAKFLAREDLPLHLLLKGAGTYVGGSGLHRIDWTVPKFEIGYWVRARFARQGYVTEAVRGITAFAFDVLGAQRVEIRCDVNNVRSAAVPRRLGFAHEATLLNDRRHPGTGAVSDTLLFAKVRPAGPVRTSHDYSA